MYFSVAHQAAALTAENISLQTGNAIFFARGVLHEASVLENDPGR
jgi:hypothetical protein